MNISRTLQQVRHGLLAFILAGFTGNVFAHAGLQLSVPAANSQVTETPRDLVLTYDKPVMLMGLTLTDSKGKTVDTQFKASHDTQLTHKHTLPPLSHGSYTVDWTSVGKDGHTMKGTFPFAVGGDAKPGDATKPHDGQHPGMDHSGHKK